MREKIYIAGPYSEGDVEANVRHAIEAAEKLARMGFAPFVPHWTHFWHMVFPHSYEFWLDLDMRFIPCCEAMLRLPGASKGATREIELAQICGIPVFHDIDSIFNCFADSTVNDQCPAASPGDRFDAEPGLVTSRKV